MKLTSLVNDLDWSSKPETQHSGNKTEPNKKEHAGKKKDYLKNFLFELGIKTERNRAVQEKEKAMPILLFLQAKLLKLSKKPVGKEITPLVSV